MELINKFDMSTGSLRKRGIKKEGKRFLLYYQFVESHLEKLEYNMKRLRETTYRDRKEKYNSQRKNEDYIIKEEDLREMLDERLRDNSYGAIQRGLQYHLWKHNIVIVTTLRLSGKRNFRFRKRTEYDFIPRSLM